MSKIMSAVLTACLLVLALSLGCKRAERSNETNASPAQSAAVPATASHAPTAPPPSEPVETVAYRTALFADKTLLMCIDNTFLPKVVEAAAKGGALDELKQFAADSAAELAKGKPDVTVLKQPCDSLGQQALATCTQHDDKMMIATHYYQESHSDKYMANCVKNGGTWSRNASAQADLQRAQQKLDKLEREGP